MTGGVHIEDRERLAERLLELVDVPSESLHEQALAAHVRDLLPASLERHHDAGESLLVATPRRPDTPLVLFAGHLDTVPAQGNIPGHRADGAVHGLGATDMKAGLAVMVELARWIGDAAPALGLDAAFLFFPREELPAEQSALPELFAAAPLIDEAELVLMMEPTDNTIQPGCLGNMNALVHFRGESAHSARPWQGVNAIELALEGLRPLAAIEPLPVEIQGLTYTEVLSLTGIEGGIATNVIPDHVSAHVNFRYAPNRTPEEAERHLRALVDGAGELEILSNSAAGRVAAEAPLVQRLRALGPFALEPKQAWTPVAEFAARGLDAVNFGPGATRFAHRRDEQVPEENLVVSFHALQRFLSA
ncbi:MAG: succinyl-diaminopimelate desuccinylase [Gaiellaceae bacterium]|nr:succinyl-diaminopimelate desuccinylase [Gaiellaceae bacterium]